MKIPIPKRGRPRIHNNPVWFGMKISLEERELIKKFAKEQGTSASRAIMEMVTKSVEEVKKPKTRLTAVEMMKLPMTERSKLLRTQAKLAEDLYKPGSDLIFPDDQEFVEY